MSTQSAATVSHKDAAASFMRLIGSGQIREAYRKHAAPSFRHHTPYFRGDADSLMKAMEENAAKNPDKAIEIVNVLEDRDLVAVHSHVRHTRDDRGAALVHIFRFARRSSGILPGGPSARSTCGPAARSSSQLSSPAARAHGTSHSAAAADRRPGLDLYRALRHRGEGDHAGDVGGSSRR